MLSMGSIWVIPRGDGHHRFLLDFGASLCGPAHLLNRTVKLRIHTIQSIAYLCLWRILMRHGPLQPPHVSCFCKSSEKSSIIVINTWHRKAGCLDNLLVCVELQTGSSMERKYCQLHHVAKNQNLFAAIHGARRCNIQPSLRVDIYISYQKDQVMFNFCN